MPPSKLSFTLRPKLSVHFVTFQKPRSCLSKAINFIIKLINLKILDTTRFGPTGLSLWRRRDKYAYFRVTCHFWRA
jgi:hypothetical protein